MEKETICGVEMPEPVAWLLDDDKTIEFEKNDYHDGPEWTPMVTTDQLRETVAAAVARKDAEIDALYKHGFQIQDERDALRAEVEQFKAQPKPQPLTTEQRQAVFIKARIEMEQDSNLSWRDSLMTQVEAAHGIGTTL